MIMFVRRCTWSDKWASMKIKPLGSVTRVLGLYNKSQGLQRGAKALSVDEKIARKDIAELVAESL
jgi:hypothetical protein